jgi:uncharacterized protein (TIGR03086 family)
MSTATGPSRPPTTVELLERAIGYTRASLLLVTEDDLGRATPCEGWLVRDLLGHLDDSLEALSVAARASALSLDPSDPPVDGADLLESIFHRARGLLGDWHPPRGGDVDLGDVSLPREVLGAVGALEIVLHGWDVAEAVGRPRPIPPDLAMDLWPVARDHITEADRPVRFAAPVQVSDWCTPATRLLAHSGRSTRRSWLTDQHQDR